MEEANAPKKYIRTFHGDMATLQQGGKPDLSPLAKPPEAAPSPSPVQTPPLTAPPPPPSQPPAPGPAPITEPPIVAPTSPQASQGTALPKPNPPQTYEGDFMERMREKQASTATVLAAEQDAAPLLIQSQPENRSRSNLLYGIAGVILLIGGGVGAYVAYGRYFSANEPVVLAPTVFAPIFVDEHMPISGRGDALKQAIEQSVTRPLAQGAVRQLYLENTATTSVFAALKLPAPGVVLRNIAPAGSMAGVVNAGGTQSPFFILSVTSYSQTFAGMLSWESSMPRSLAAFFPAYPAASEKTIATTTAATSTPSVASATPAVPASFAGFIDAMVANHDVRLYRDAARRTILLYGYWDQKTLVIARDEAAFTEILRRLATSRAPQ